MIEDYIIERTLNESKYSKVVLAKHKLINEQVTIKILSKSKLNSTKHIIRIQNEIKILESVNHPNLLKLYQTLEDSDNYYLVTKLADGGELFDSIVRKKKISENQASIFFTQLIYALEYLESKNIAHRDIKPENLLINNENELILIDFGLSRFYEKNELIDTPCGSPCYAAPEVLLCPQYNGIMSDIWSSGIVLYAMVCGFLPYEEEEGNNEKLYKKILSTKYEMPSELSSNLRDLLSKILVVNPDKRIMLNDIKKHSFLSYGIAWYKEHFKKIEKIYDLKKENVNNDILEIMNIYGIKDSKEQIIKDILSNSKNKTTTVYYLLIQKFGINYEINNKKDELKDKHISLIPIKQKIINEDPDNKTLLLTDINIKNKQNKYINKISFRPKTDKSGKKTKSSIYCTTDIDSPIINHNTCRKTVVNLNKNYNIMINNFNTSLNRNTLNKMHITGNKLSTKLITNNTANSISSQWNNKTASNECKKKSNISLDQKILNKIGEENSNLINSNYEKEICNSPSSIGNSFQGVSCEKYKKKLSYVPKFWPYCHSTDGFCFLSTNKKHSTKKTSRTFKYFSSPKNKLSYFFKSPIKKNKIKNLNSISDLPELAENRAKIMSNRVLFNSADSKKNLDLEISLKNNFSISNNTNPFVEKKKNVVISKLLIVNNKLSKIKLKKKKSPKITSHLNINFESSKCNKKINYYQTTNESKSERNKGKLKKNCQNNINKISNQNSKKNKRINSNIDSNVETMFFNYSSFENKDLTEKINNPKNNKGHTILIPTFLENKIIEKNIKEICNENKVELIIRKDNKLPFFICYKNDMMIRIEIVQHGENREIKINQIKGDIMDSKNFIKKIIISIGL